MSNLYHLEHEKHFLSAAVRNPLLLDDYANAISDKDFSKTHRVIYQAIKSIKREKGECNKLLLIDKLKSCNQRIAEEIEADLYINALDIIPVSEAAVPSIVKELASKTIQRELNQMAQEILEKTSSKETKNGLDLLNEVTSTFNRKVNILDSVRSNEPKSLFANAEEYIENLGNNPRSDGAECPFPIFRDLFGDFSIGDMSFIIARPKAGKSTFLLNVLIKCNENAIKGNKRFKALYLDTELEYEREIRRLVSALSGVGEYWLRTGFWRKNADMTQKVRAVWPIVREWTKRVESSVDHIYIGGMKLPEILSVVRRWHGKNVGLNDDTDTIVCLDYVKLGSADDLNGAVKDYQLVGQKVDAHKQLASELRYHCLTAGQSNRLNEGKDEKEIVSDGRAVGLSDQISMFASNIYLLQKLTLGQYAMFKEAATHSLIPLYTRNQGPQSQGFNSAVRYSDHTGATKYCDNFLLYNFHNFNVDEFLDFREWSKRNDVAKIDLTKKDEKDKNLPI